MHAGTIVYTARSIGKSRVIWLICFSLFYQQLIGSLLDYVYDVEGLARDPQPGFPLLPSPNAIKEG